MPAVGVGQAAANCHPSRRNPRREQLAVVITSYRRRYAPVPVAVALGAGIVADRWLTIPLDWWLASAITALVFLLYLDRHCSTARQGFRQAKTEFPPTRSPGGLEPSPRHCCCVGSPCWEERHHLFWAAAASNDISLFAEEGPPPGPADRGSGRPARDYSGPRQSPQSAWDSAPTRQRPRSNVNASLAGIMILQWPVGQHCASATI